MLVFDSMRFFKEFRIEELTWGIWFVWIIRASVPLFPLDLQKQWSARPSAHNIRVNFQFPVVSLNFLAFYFVSFPLDLPPVPNTTTLVSFPCLYSLDHFPLFFLFIFYFFILFFLFCFWVFHSLLFLFFYFLGCDYAFVPSPSHCIASNNHLVTADHSSHWSESFVRSDSTISLAQFKISNFEFFRTINLASFPIFLTWFSRRRNFIQRLSDQRLLSISFNLIAFLHPSGATDLKRINAGSDWIWFDVIPPGF